MFSGNITPQAYIEAAGNGQQDIVEQYIVANAGNPDALNVSFNEYSALERAVFCHQHPIVELLLNTPGIDIDASGSDRTPLMLAAVSKSKPMVRLLLNAGADSAKQNALGCTASSVTKDDEIKEIISNHEFEEWQAQDKFFLGILAGDETVVDEYIKNIRGNPARAINIKDSCGNPALVLALCCSHIQIAKKILAVPGVDVNAMNGVGYTPLRYAAIANFPDIVSILLDFPELGIDDYYPKTGQTALMLAAQAGHAGIVNQLLNARAKVTVRNVKGNTAITLAKNDEIRQMLLEANTPARELLIFQAKRAKEVAHLQSLPENAQAERQAKMQVVADTTLKSALSDVQFLTDHLHEIGNLNQLSELITQFALLLAGINSKEVNLDKHTHDLLTVVAASGHVAAQRVVAMYQEPTDDPMLSSPSALAVRAASTLFFSQPASSANTPPPAPRL